MNTAKQVNIMIGLLLVAFLLFAGYYVTEGAREQAGRETQDELMATRGATLFVNNCRPCHGIEGMGPDDGGIAPKLHNVAFLVLDANNPFNLPKTPDGEAQGIHDFLFDTISCGRTNTAMPTWSQDHGGPLANVQIQYIVSMITQGRWDLVKQIGEEHDAVALDQEAASYTLFGKAYQQPYDPGEKAADHPEKALSKDTLGPDGKTVVALGEKSLVDQGIAYRSAGRLKELPADRQALFAKMKTYAQLSPDEKKAVDTNFKRGLYVDPTGVAITGKNCGQYGAAAQDFRSRDPFGGAAPAPAAGAPAAGGSAPAAGGAAPAGGDPIKAGAAAAQAYGCAACHSVTGTAGVGPTWKGLAGSKVDLADGSSVTADDAYLKESIENPGAKVVKGFANGIMPADISKQFKPGDLDNLIAYIKSLK